MLLVLLVLLVAALVDGAAVGALGVRIIAKKSRAKLGGCCRPFFAELYR